MNDSTTKSKKYRTTKSVKVYPTEEQQKHLEKIRFAWIWTYNWALDCLHENPKLTEFDLVELFVQHKHEHPEIKMIVEDEYHQHATVRAYVAFRRAKKDGSTLKHKKRKNVITFGAYHNPSIKDDNTISLAGIHDLHTNSLESIQNPKSYTITNTDNQYMLNIHE